MIPPEIIRRIKETINLEDEFHQKIYTNELDNFFDWFSQKGEIFPVVCNKDLNADIREERLVPNCCFSNGQYLAHKYREQEIEYAEGYVLYEDHIQFREDYISHGFNIFNGKVTDYTLAPLIESDRFTPQEEYYGVIIPLEYIMEKRGRDIENIGPYCPLIIDFFRDSIRPR